MRPFMSSKHTNIRILLILLIVSLLCAGCCSNNSSMPTNPLQIQEEDYSVLLHMPAQNYIFEENATPPVFTWRVQKGVPETFTIEIDYLGGEPYLCKTVTGRISYALSIEDWETIKAEAPAENGLLKIYWRIRIDYSINPDKGSYYSQWGYFGIQAS